ncbi:mCG144812, partial [Mus musculus]
PWKALLPAEVHRRCDHSACCAHRAGFEKLHTLQLIFPSGPEERAQVSLPNQAFPKPRGPGLGEGQHPLNCQYCGGCARSTGPSQGE